MSSLQKLDKAKLLLHQYLSIHLISLKFEPKLARIHAILRDNVQLFIRYNNYDDRWEVTTRPHHFHPRKKKIGIQSPMIGNPEKDIQTLCELILSNKLYYTD